MISDAPYVPAGRFQGCIDASDHGAGIAVDQLALLGHRFYPPEERIEMGDQRRGSELGLTIARRMANLHGGALSVLSAAGIGTCVRRSLPSVDDGARG